MLTVENLVKTYPARRKTPAVEAVRGVSFSVPAGEFFGLLGPNGAGKSTTLGCINTLVRPTSGRITVDGTDVVKDPLAARRRIAVVPQNRNLDRDLSVREVLTYHGRYFGLPSAEREARADRLLDELQIADKAGAKPLTLSGGQQQTGDDRARAHARPQGAAPRRADHRARSPGAASAVGDPARPARLRPHHHPHHALHGRSRPALPAPGHRGPRQDPDPGHARRPQGHPARRPRSSTCGCAPRRLWARASEPWPGS